MLDQSLVEEKFVPNDVELDGGANRLLIITGPNMAGKSTFIRQVALLTLMAQIGQLRAGARGGDRAGGPDFHAGGGERRSLARAIDLHGGDE